MRSVAWPHLTTGDITEVVRIIRSHNAWRTMDRLVRMYKLWLARGVRASGSPAEVAVGAGGGPASHGGVWSSEGALHPAGSFRGHPLTGFPVVG